MTEEDEEDLKEMLNGILFILGQQQAKMWGLYTCLTHNYIDATYIALKV